MRRGRWGPDARVRVLVADGSAVTRAVLGEALGSFADIELVGQAASASHALALMDRRETDVILLDLDLPDLEGSAALPLLAAHASGARVLALSATCSDRAQHARAARLGAEDILLKPAGLNFADAFAGALVARIRRLGRVDRTSPSADAAVAPTMRAIPKHAAAVGIAASTGGVPALRRLLAALPSDYQAPILVTQHLPDSFIPFFVGQLQEATGRPGRVAETGMLPRCGEILVAPGHAHLALARTGPLIHVRLETGKASSGCCPSADPMFSSLARLYGSAAAGVVLSGMGRDGAEGAGELAAAGAAVFAQDAATSVVWGMPGAVVRRGHAGAVLPPEAIATALASGVRQECRAWS